MSDKSDRSDKAPHRTLMHTQSAFRSWGLVKCKRSRHARPAQNSLNLAMERLSTSSEQA